STAPAPPPSWRRPQPRARAPLMAWACSWPRPRKASTSGAASCPTPLPCWQPCEPSWTPRWVPPREDDEDGGQTPSHGNTAIEGNTASEGHSQLVLAQNAPGCLHAAGRRHPAAAILVLLQSILVQH